MSDKSQDEKTEEPTQQRRDDFRKRGQVAQTKELTSAVMLLSVLLVSWFLGKFFLGQLLEVFNLSFGDLLVKSAREGDWIEAGSMAFEKTFLLIAPVAIFFWVLGFACSVMQVGFLVNEEALQFKPERLDPIQGFKRIFSLRSLVEGIKAIIKVVLVGAIAALVIQSEMLEVPRLISYTVEQLFTYLGSITFKLLGGVGTLMLVLAGFDFFFQKWDMEKQMRMTKQEVKEEHKSREGDPLIKARIKRVQREMANRRMMEDVPKADVIVTNPTHIAIALKYDETMISPKVIAKGADAVAERIKEVAREHKIPIVENKPLARAVFKSLKIGQSIPRELYTAVAEVLSYVYKLKSKVLS